MSGRTVGERALSRGCCCLYLFAGLGLSSAVLAQPASSQATPAPVAPAPPPATPAPASKTDPAREVPETEATPKPAASSGSAHHEEPALTRLLSRQRDALGRSCELQQVASKGPLRFLACGAAGMWIVRVIGDNAIALDMQDLGGRVGPFFEANGHLWVQVSSIRAQEIEAGVYELSPPPAAAAPAPAQPASAPPPPPLASAASTLRPLPTPSPREEAYEPGRVVGRDDEQVVVAIPGPRLKPGTHVALVSSSERASGEEQVYAVGQVAKSAFGRARVVIGLNEDVPDNADARITLAPRSNSIFAPPRAGGVWELGFIARPFLVLENLGAGAMLDGYVGYRMKAPFHLQASVVPLAFGSARAGAAGALGAYVSGAYDAHLFEVGLGLGGQTVNDPDFALDPGSGLLLAQKLRLGARDGAHVAFVSYVTLFHSNFQFSSLRVDVQVPVGARTWLRLAGGGGSLGIGFGEVGLRALMSGNGGAGSFFLTTVIGWAHLFRECNEVPQVSGSAAASSCTSVDYNGPMLGAGGEFRL
ncbi:MAG TPA: hypothetical protein VFN67_12260 [Polyangiales bacterium]|nr:hypothetical protein [Polyangiales bacterium]